jgi:hypothetical protein
MFARDVELEKSSPTAGSMNVGQEKVTRRTLGISGIGSAVGSGASVDVADGPQADTIKVINTNRNRSFFMFLLRKW